MKTCPECRNLYSNSNAFCPRDGVSLSLVDHFAPGAILGHKFRIVEELGRGGMGIVYRARHIVLDHDRALKLIKGHHSADSQALRRFISEAIMANRIEHPNVVRVLDVDQTEDGEPYIVMEYVAGKSLRHILRQDGTAEQRPLDALRAVNIASQVCGALAAAHEKLIIHRDVKPDNILVIGRPNGPDVIKVVDFGLGKALRELQDVQENETSAVSHSALFVGTPQYCSPEQVMGAEFHQLDHRTDIYSLGVVLYEMLTGRPPFSGPLRNLLEHQVTTPPQPPDHARPDLHIPETVSDITMKALSKDPRSRFGTALEMQAALNSAFVPEPPIRVTGNLSESRAKMPAPIRLAFAGGIILGVALMIAALLTFRAPHTPPASNLTNNLTRARQAFEDGSYEDAIRIYKEVLASDRTNAEATKGLETAQIAKAAEEQVFGKPGESR
jgi:serine/threonine-protein kinase